MHNSIADFLADRAHEAQDLGGLKDFLGYHATKRRSFHKLLVDINMLIIRVLAEEEALREAKCSPQPTAKYPCTLQIPSGRACFL